MHLTLECRVWQTFSVKVQMVNILGFVGCMVSVATSQLCNCSAKAGIDNTEMDGYGWVPVKFYLQIQVVQQAWLVHLSLPVPTLECSLWTL